MATKGYPNPGRSTRLFHSHKIEDDRRQYTEKERCNGPDYFLARAHGGLLGPNLKDYKYRTNQCKNA